MTITSDKTVFCYLYFDEIIPIKITIEGNGGVVPDTLGYNKTVACKDSSTAIYNTKYNRLEFTNINEEIKCTLTYTEDTTDYPTLKSIVDTAGTSGNGEIVNANGYRYTGQEPNNYVWFNNEMWRIIGSIPACTTASCGTGSNLVKIIRNESIGGLAYDGKSSGYTGAWGSNTLYTLLNSYYYGNEDNTQTVKGHVRLMAASDYGYAASKSYHNVSMGSYSSSSTPLTNWLYNQGYEWTLVQGTSGVLRVSANGNIYDINANSGHGVRPVVYLDSLVYVTNGTGTALDPYQIAL